MKFRKYLSALLVLLLVAGLCPAATMEDANVISAAVEPEVSETEGVDVGGLYAADEVVELAAELWEDAPDESAFAVSAETSDTSLVRITQPADGATVSTGRIKLFCTFVNPTPSSFDVRRDAWKYIPMRVQVLRDGAVVSDDYISDYSGLWFTDEGAQYATLTLWEPGTYTIRARVPGSPDAWDSVTFTASGATVTVAPIATRAPVTDDVLAVITSPEHGGTVKAEEKFPICVQLRPATVGSATLTGEALYSPLTVQVLNREGNLAWGTDVNIESAELEAQAGNVIELVRPSVDVGGNYTVRVKAPGSSSWDSVQIFANGPTYPRASESAGFKCTPKQTEVTVDLAEDPVAHLEYTLSTDADPENNFTYYADFLEDGNDVVKYNRMSGNTFSKSGGLWTCDGWIEYTGLSVGTATLHMYLLVNAQRYDHHAVTINVIDSSKVTVQTPEPTAAPKVSLSKARLTVKAQTWTGKAIKPAVTVKLNGKALKQGTDYKVSYKNNVKIGKATVTVTGKGNYAGSKKATFAINPAKVKGLKLQAGNKQLTATWKKASGGVTGYQIQYGLKKDFTGAKKATVKKAATVKKVLKKLTAGKTYYVRIRAYKTVNGKIYWSEWSGAVKSSKVK